MALRYVTLAFAALFVGGALFTRPRTTATGGTQVRAAFWSAALALVPVLVRCGRQRLGNTVLVHAELLTYPMLGLPAGLSLSYVIDWDDLTLPIRSRYVLLRPEDTTVLAGRPLRLAALATTSVGTLYRNLDSPSAPALHESVIHDPGVADPAR